MTLLAAGPASEIESIRGLTSPAPVWQNCFNRSEGQASRDAQADGGTDPRSTVYVAGLSPRVARLR